jgi:acyl phosphate:glycerol-3-phosphate acyltransferase
VLYPQAPDPIAPCGSWEFSIFYMTLLLSCIALTAAYLLGSLSFAVIVSRCMGLSDPRSYGSGNPGATNVLRSGNKVAAVLTLALDAVKGAVPVWCVLRWGGPFGLTETAAAAVGLAAFLGHLWPVFFRFQGGKGVATASGVLWALNPALGLLTCATWLLVVVVSRYSSLGALAAALFAPLWQMVFWGISWSVLWVVVMAVLLIWRHRANILKLLAGTESQLGKKPRLGGGA